MKTILICFLLFAATTYAQNFSLPTEIGQGFKFKDYSHPQFYMVKTSVSPTMEFGIIRTSAIVMTAFSDGYTYLFAGAGVSGEVFRSKSLGVNAGLTALPGSEGRALYGVVVKLEHSSNLFISLNARREVKYNELWFDGSVGINLFK